MTKKRKMKLSKKERQEVFELVKELLKKVAGKNSEVFATLLYEKKNVNEFKLAEALKMTINQVRNILYKMLEHNILSFTRKKDKKKGWYTYYWTLETQKALEALKKFKIQEIKQLEQLIHNRQIKKYYVCPNECLEMTTETAMLHDFACPECGTLLQPSDEDKKIKEMTSKIEILKKEIETIEGFLKRAPEAEKVKAKIERKKERKRKKVKKQKKLKKIKRLKRKKK
ncbi:MAG: hypothetical protein QXL88_02860 [Candidatus Pacearchaeota archaeon]